MSGNTGYSIRTDLTVTSHILTKFHAFCICNKMCRFFSLLMKSLAFNRGNQCDG